MRYSLKRYIGVEEVFNRASASLKSYFDSDLVLTDDYYKVIDLCNSQMGLRVNPSKEAMIPLDNYTAVLPDDFLLLSLALVVDKCTEKHTAASRRVETLTGVCPTAEDLTSLDKCCNFKLQCGLKPVLTCEIETIEYEFETTYITRLTEKKHCTTDCFNLYGNCPYYMEIDGNQIYTDALKTGNIYILYTAAMNSKDNIPTCLDHPIALEYYEQALIYRILKDLYINKRLEVAQALPLAKQDYLVAKNAAISLASTPEFHEMISINNALKRQFRKRNYI